MIFVAIPAYDAKVCVETIRSLLDEQSMAHIAGLEMSVNFLPGCSLVTQARNQLAKDFLASGADRMVFVDSDVAWEPGSLLRLASHPVDLVGGAYRLKDSVETYPIGLLGDATTELWADPATGLLEIETLPGGFLSISRGCLTKLRDAHPERAYGHYGHEYHAYFHNPIQDGRLYGEDAAFCLDWRTNGGKVWLDPELTLTHVGGSQKFVGKIGDWLRARALSQAA